MSAEDWKYVDNQFLVATIGSFKRMNIVINDHSAKLITAVVNDATLQSFLTVITASKTQWDGNYSAWQNARASYRSLTDIFEGYLTQLQKAPATPGGRSLVDAWFSKVSGVVSSTHPDYIYFFPRGRDPFTTDGRDEIVQNIKTLGERLAERADEIEEAATTVGAPQELLDRYNAYIALAPVVTAFHAAIKAARDTQQGAEGTVDQLRVPLEASRVACATDLYGNLGGLMQKYKATPVQIAGFFDLDTLRETGSDDEEEEGGSSSSSYPHLPPRAKVPAHWLTKRTHTPRQTKQTETRMQPSIPLTSPAAPLRASLLQAPAQPPAKGARRTPAWRLLLWLVPLLALGGCAVQFVSPYDAATDAAIQAAAVKAETIFAKTMTGGMSHSATQEDYRELEGQMAVIAVRAEAQGSKNVAEMGAVKSIRASMANLEKWHRRVGPYDVTQVAGVRSKFRSLLHHEKAKQSATETEVEGDAR